MKAISIIRSEHRSLGAVLFTLEQLVSDINAGKQPDFRLLHGMMTYIDRFLNTFHHPKEDVYLMPALRARHPEAVGVIEEIHDEHQRGGELFYDMLKALSAFEFSRDMEFSSFDIAVLAYVQFEKDHAMKEEREILPLAKEFLTDADWHSIDVAFEDNDDPMFGGRSTKIFKDLYCEIVNRTPQPYGLGQQWPARNLNK